MPDRRCAAPANAARYEEAFEEFFESEEGMDFVKLSWGSSAYVTMKSRLVDDYGHNDYTTYPVTRAMLYQAGARGVAASVKRMYMRKLQEKGLAC